MALFVDLVALSKWIRWLYFHGLGGSATMEYSLVVFSKTLSNWKVEIINSFCISKADYNVSKDTGEITVEQKRINNALMENRNAIIKLVTKAANGYRNWERFRNRCMLVLEKGIDFEIDKDDGSIKMVEKKDPDN